MRAQASADGGATACRPAEQLCPGPRAGTQARDICEVDGQGLGAVRCDESHDDAVGQRTCPVWVQLTADGLSLAGRRESGGGFAEGVLIDGEETLLDAV